MAWLEVVCLESASSRSFWPANAALKTGHSLRKAQMLVELVGHLDQLECHLGSSPEDAPPRMRACAPEHFECRGFTRTHGLFLDSADTQLPCRAAESRRTLRRHQEQPSSEPPPISTGAVFYRRHISATFPDSGWGTAEGGRPFLPVRADRFGVTQIAVRTETMKVYLRPEALSWGRLGGRRLLQARKLWSGHRAIDEVWVGH